MVLEKTEYEGAHKLDPLAGPSVGNHGVRILNQEGVEMSKAGYVAAASQCLIWFEWVDGNGNRLVLDKEISDGGVD